jgi:hypothetical protein
MKLRLKPQYRLSEASSVYDVRWIDSRGETALSLKLRDENRYIVDRHSLMGMPFVVPKNYAVEDLHAELQRRRLHSLWEPTL